MAMRSKRDPVDPLPTGLARHPITRRQLLRAAGAGVAGVSLASLLAACGDDGGSAPDGGASPSAGFDWSSQQEAGVLNFGNWPFYMDKGKVDGEKGYPSLARFTQDTGIEVDYREVIEDYASFFTQLRPLLEADQDTGYDLIMTGYPRWLPQMRDLGYLIPLDHAQLPNFDQYVADKYKDPSWDPGNMYGMPYFSIMTGIGYDPELTGREITSFNDLLDPEFAGKVGMLVGVPEDMPNLALLGLGVEPSTSTPEDWQRAADVLTKQRDDGIVRKYYGQSYINELQNGNIALSMAWAPDIFQSNLSGFPNLKFVLPEEGGLLAIDTLCIPQGAQHPVDAITYMNYIYQPEISAMMTSWIQGVPPVPDAKEVLASTGFKDLAESPLIFPDEQTYANLHEYRTLTPQEQQEWDDLFLPIYLT
jgi:spermidine/putrescine transport system substrate-binding protein